MSKLKKAIVIDDEESVRNFLKKVLTKWGYETITYKSPFEFECISDSCKFQCIGEDFPPDLLLTDIKMPGMTGIEFLYKILKKGCPIIKMGIMSGYWEENYQRTAEELDCKQFNKPLRVEDIRKWTLED